MPSLARCLAFLLLVEATLSDSPAAAAPVRTAAEICASAADPCTIDRAYEVAAGSLLDFGLRGVRIAAGGLLDFVGGDAQLTCGRLNVETTAIAIRIRSAALPGARVEVSVRGRCSGDASAVCLFDSTCEAIGAGNCSSADAGAVLGARLVGDSEGPGAFVLRAAGDIAIRGALSLSSTAASGDGGVVVLESTKGSVRVDAGLAASGGGSAAGGRIDVMAALDVGAGAPIDATGGDFDGGTVAIDAGRDVSILADLRVEATGGAGAGGEIAVTAGRNIEVSGGTRLRPLSLDADGRQSSDSRGGDGGVVSLEAEGDLRWSRYARIAASGAPPDGFADSVFLRAGGELVFDGSVVARGRGMFGGGAVAVVESDTAIALGPDSSIDLGGAAAGGDLVLESEGDLASRGRVDVSGGAGGVAGRVVAVAGGDVDVGGSWATAGASVDGSLGELFAEGCRVRVEGAMRNAAESGTNRLVGREGVSAAPGAAIWAGGRGGSNEIRYRRDAGPPSLAATFTPSPRLVADPSLPGCPVCDGSDRSCDDGNPCTLDRCGVSGRCAHQSSAAPCDDGDFCSVGEVCIDGECPAPPPAELSVESWKARLRRGLGRDLAIWKATFPSVLLPADPQSAGLRVVLGTTATPLLLDATLDAGMLRHDRGSWRYRAPRRERSGGLVRVDIEPSPRGEEAIVKIRVAGADLAEAFEADGLRTSLVFGSRPEEAPCAGSADLECERSARALRCRSPLR
jgi:hypothetical protein